VTTRSGALLDPQLPENRETARISLGELAQKQADDEVFQEVKRSLETAENHASTRMRIGCSAEKGIGRAPNSC